MSTCLALRGERRGLQAQPHLEGTQVLLSLLPQGDPMASSDVSGASGFGWLHGGREMMVSAEIGMWYGCLGEQEWAQHKECSQGSSLRGTAEELVSDSV